MNAEIECYFNSIYGGGNDEFVESPELNISLEELMTDSGNIDYKEFFEEIEGGAIEDKNKDEYFKSSDSEPNSKSNSESDSDSEIEDNNPICGGADEEYFEDDYFEDFNKNGSSEFFEETNEFFDTPIDDSEYFKGGDGDEDEYFEGGEEYNPYNPNFSETPSDEILQAINTDKRLSPLKEKNNKLKEDIDKYYSNIKEIVIIKTPKDVMKYLDL